MAQTLTRTARGPMRLVETDWGALSPAEQLRWLEVEGFVILPGLLDAAAIARLKDELADLPMNSAPYSPEQKFAARPPQWHSPAFAELIGHPGIIAFLRQAMGDDLVFMLGHYVTSGPGVPGLTLHSDYQPFGSEQKGFEESSPATVRILIYLDDLTPERAPFTILPRSHLSLHQHADPYVRYDDHPDMATVCLNGGDGIVFNVKAFHGTHPNLSDFTRGMIELAYRPGWAKPAGPVDEWDPEAVAAAPEIAKPWLRPRNSGPLSEANGAVLPGADIGLSLSPQRWE